MTGASPAIWSFDWLVEQALRRMPADLAIAKSWAGAAALEAFKTGRAGNPFNGMTGPAGEAEAWAALRVHYATRLLVLATERHVTHVVERAAALTAKPVAKARPIRRSFTDLSQPREDE